jgi:hypothetical protein
MRYWLRPRIGSAFTAYGRPLDRGAAAVGLVLSATNMSLVPYEMLAACCIPVVNDAEHNRCVLVTITLRTPLARRSSLRQRWVRSPSRPRASRRCHGMMLVPRSKGSSQKLSRTPSGARHDSDMPWVSSSPCEVAGYARETLG